MKKISVLIFVTILLCNIINITISPTANAILKEETSNTYNVTMKQDLLCLMIAYPEYITNIEEKNGYVYLVLKSEKKLKYDDKIRKNSQEKLANPDLQDTLEQIYPLSAIRSIMKTDYDPGRARSYGLLTEVYGCSKNAIEANLTKVKVGYNNYQFNKSNSAASSLQAVMKEVIPLSQTNQNVRKCLLPCSGTFNYRMISGTSRLSPHAFGIAIDLASDKRDYWKWASKEAGEKRLASYPPDLVEIFEKNGFIWGGKWSHFDILHFEYRPEIILKARYFTNSVDLKKSWYEGAPLQQSDIKNAIEKIDALIK
ncbi:M15 family metallopeptidase [Clostridium estertheticum]|uniref:M15 family metallopeptidase n=1 Tax=Clostridium estertheticum TaxID=238834 RepID=UPI0013E94E89|nr:M15 family metallopeptidase [Clostridium estertheticum]MBZ9687562.1 M15 family metallopeptidase [Clostridium estertheticum]